MAVKQGSLSINSENIFPIIKKWLYSDHDIFYRELISNGCDAITKLQKLEVMGEYAFPEGYRPRIDVVVNPEEKTITVSDNGIGMTFEEVDEYINQIAFSGARDFLEKYKDKTNEDQIIGHFGLGFYSAFMVSDRVTIETKSWKNDAPGVFWESEGGSEFRMEESGRTEPGTTITLYVNEDSLEFVNEYRAKEVLTKYCSFMPVEIFLKNANKPAEPEKAADEETEEKIIEIDENGQEILDADAGEEEKDEKPKEEPINDTNPLWNKAPVDCTEEEYKKFYRTVFNDYKEPLFWIHLNMDYPFRLKGILYFPKVTSDYEPLDGVIKLYNTQVFIADNIKEVIPEFLMLLKGVIDCPDLPLNVSRSALQNDGFVKKISDYITKKVADRLSGMCKTDKTNYEKYWDDIAPFIKYGYIRDEKFRDKIKDFMLYKNLEGKYLTLPECLEENKDVRANTVFYLSNEKEQGQYIQMFKEAGLDAVYLTHSIDSPFISCVEQSQEDLHFVSVDADLDDVFKEKVDENDEAFKADAEALTEVFRKALNDENMTVQVEKLKNESIAAMITKSEDAKRMEEMFKRYTSPDKDVDNSMGGYGQSLVLNANHPLVRYILANQEAEQAPMFCKQLYDLALLSHAPLSPSRMGEFVRRSQEILMLLTK
ncbi:MAG: molecular chaperone HtpG [Lachnospiraceae bacterium]|nr:molecular chaperone HtpG [Lachnospiraceae bacterium]